MSKINNVINKNDDKKIEAIANPNQNIFHKMSNDFQYIGTKLSGKYPSNTGPIKQSASVKSITLSPEEQKTLVERKYQEQLRDEQRAYEKEQLEDSRKYNDSLYSRRISDMRKSGINPNLFNNIQGDSISVNSSDNNIMLENLRNMLEEELKGEELSNETFNNIFRSVATILGLAFFKK